MEQTQLVELLKTLTPLEREQLMDFARIPSVNNGRFQTQVITLLGICLDIDWSDPAISLSKEQAYSLVFDGHAYVDGKLDKVMVEAHRMVKMVVLHQNYFHVDNQFQQQFDFAEIVRKRGLEARHQSILSKLQKIQFEIEKKDDKYFLLQFLLEKAIHDKEAVNNQFKGDLNIPNTLIALGVHYHINRLAMLNFFLLQNKVAKIGIEALDQAIFQGGHIPQTFVSQSATLSIHYEIYKLLVKDKLDPYDINHIHTMIKNYKNCLTNVNLNEFYTYLRNICTLVLSDDPEKREIHLLLFDLYNESLERGLLHYEGRLHASRYFAVTNNALSINNFEWAKKFIEKYKDDIIGETETKDVHRLNLAYYLFAVGNFADCLDVLPYSAPHVDYLIRCKRLELKCLYELQSDLLSYKMDAFKMFLSRTSPKLISDKNRRGQTDFANFLAQLMNSTPGDQKRAEKIQARLREKKHTSEWRWLMEKAKDLGDPPKK